MLRSLYCLVTTVLLASCRVWHARAEDYWANTVERTKTRTELQWDWGHTYSGVAIDGQPMTTVLSSLLSNYRFTLPVVQLERGISYRGSSSRLRHAVGRLLTGHSVHVGLIGGRQGTGVCFFAAGNLLSRSLHI
jgi:hypothetical protein